MKTNDLLEKLKGRINEPIGKSITFFQVLGENNSEDFVPMIFWLTTSDHKCYRFFLDAWVLHWMEYTPIKMKELIEEDFEVYDSYVVKDLMLNFKLKGKVITNVKMDYIKHSEQLITKFFIEIENGETIELLDYGDEKEQKLKILRS